MIIDDFNRKRMEMSERVEKARREINDLRTKKKPTSKDVNRMATLASYNEAYVNFAQVIREAEILNTRIKSLIVGMEIMEEKLWTK